MHGANRNRKCNTFYNQKKLEKQCMLAVNPYFKFNGNTEEASNFGEIITEILLINL